MTPDSTTRLSAVILLTVVVCSFNACAALQPTDPNGPRSNLPPYPVFVNEPAGSESATLEWQKLSQRYGLPQDTPAVFDPLLGTLHGLPPNSGAAIFLPKVGGSVVQTEEETRESLRRFSVDWQELIGAEPSQLSLVERSDEGNGTKSARYEQRPFRYPLRGEFGKLSIHFQSDRRVLSITSTCLPNTDRLQAALANLTTTVTSDKALTLVKDHPISVTSIDGQQRSFTLPSNTGLEVHQLVAYAITSKDQLAVELHLAWEIDVANGPIKTIYLDAISEQVIAVM
jgi:hypothetical protein